MIPLKSNQWSLKSFRHSRDILQQMLQYLQQLLPSLTFQKLLRGRGSLKHPPVNHQPANHNNNTSNNNKKFLLTLRGRNQYMLNLSLPTIKMLQTKGKSYLQHKSLNLPSN